MWSEMKHRAVAGFLSGLREDRGVIVTVGVVSVAAIAYYALTGRNLFEDLHLK